MLPVIYFHVLAFLLFKMNCGSCLKEASCLKILAESLPTQRDWKGEGKNSWKQKIQICIRNANGRMAKTSIILTLTNYLVAEHVRAAEITRESKWISAGSNLGFWQNSIFPNGLNIFSFQNMTISGLTMHISPLYQYVLHICFSHGDALFLKCWSERSCLWLKESMTYWCN